MEKEIVDREGWMARLPQIDRNLFSMYSSVTDCIITDQALMAVPVDDHMVHRGDGVFVLIIFRVRFHGLLIPWEEVRKAKIHFPRLVGPDHQVSFLRLIHSLEPNIFLLD